MLRIPATVLNAQLTLMDSAQVFHFRKNGHTFGMCIGDRLLLLQEEPGGYIADGDLSDSEIVHYLDLDTDYDAIRCEFAGFPLIDKAFRLLPGLRVLQQPTWDTVLTFICSANNNSARIRSLVTCLCEEYGFSTGGFIGLPDPRTLAEVTEQNLRDRKFGYRAKYLADTAVLVRDGFDLSSATDLDYAQAKAHLMQLPGVGGKVADCILLFGCGHTEAFPVDVWVERLLCSWFGIHAGTREKAACQARTLLGPHAGLAQQFLFHCARTGLITLDRDVFSEGGKTL